MTPRKKPCAPLPGLIGAAVRYDARRGSGPGKQRRYRLTRDERIRLGAVDIQKAGQQLANAGPDDDVFLLKARLTGLRFRALQLQKQQQAS